MPALVGFRCCYCLYALLLFVVSAASTCYSLFVILDPNRSFLIDLVPTAEGTPWLLFVAYGAAVLGGITMMATVIGCCGGALRGSPGAAYLFGLCLAILWIGDLVVSILAATGESYISSASFRYRYETMVRREYGRPEWEWVTQLVDRVQYFRRCCGVDDWGSYNASYFTINYSPGSYQVVPPSCCTQVEVGSWWDALRPLDDEGCLFKPVAAPSARHQAGCFRDLIGYYSDHSLVFLILALVLIGVKAFGVIISCCLCKRLWHHRATKLYGGFQHSPKHRIGYT